jgi:hypothetical protein
VAEEAGVGHLENAADVAGFVAVEEEAGLGGVGVEVAGSLEEAEGDERVEEVAGERGWRPVRPARSSNFSGRVASSVKMPISTALSRVLEAQNPMPICMMWSGVSCACAFKIWVSLLE